MIRLTLKANADPEIHLFNKSIILIGADSSQVDLVLTESYIHPIHLKIVDQSGVFFALNETNDPFVSINDHPFGKKLLQNGDLIQVHHKEIKFENLSTVDLVGVDLDSNKVVANETQATPVLPLTVNNSVSSPNKLDHLLKITLPFDEDVEILKDEEFQPGNLKEILEGNEPLVNQPEDHFFSSTKPLDSSKNSTSKKLNSSLKDDYLRELEDDTSKTNPFLQVGETSHLYQAWKWILLFIFSTFAIAGLVGTILYYSLSGKTEAQETKASQAVADIAMALTHAQLYELKPHNQNWSDVEFLKKNIQTILPNSPSYASQIDGQGQFHCCPYSLRIYTNSDLTRFLLIAQPAPSIFYWLIPKSIIVLDSESMELRTFTDVRSINRALANSEPLDRVNGKEIGALVKQGKLIRLSALANESSSVDFAPPKNIAWIKPGAENYIYNAPRYYRLGQNLLQQAINLATSKATGHEVSVLKQNVANFSRLNNLILYSESKKIASLSKHSLMLFAPSDKFLFGYLLLNNQGNIYEVHLLKEEGGVKDITSIDGQNDNTNVLAFQNSLSIHTPENKQELTPENKQELNENETVDFNHPIYIQLHALVVDRENELRPLSAALFSILSQELDSPKAHFQTEFQNLYHTYLITNSRHKQNIRESLIALYHQYEDMPIDQFVAFVNQLHLNHLVLQKDQTLSLVDENCIQNLENIFTHIDKCQSLLELDNLVHIALTWLNFDYLKDPQELIKYQNLLRNNILEQLDCFLLSRKKPITVKKEDKETLRHILDHERIIKTDEKEYFLAEFDELIAFEKIRKENEKRRSV